MARLGGDDGFVAKLDGQVLRIVGLAFAGWASLVISASVTGDVGLSVTEDATAASAVADLGAVPALVEFCLAHPAYPGLLLVGLVMIVAGDDTPLLGS